MSAGSPPTPAEVRAGISPLRLGAVVVVASGLFVALFLTGGAGAFDFWWWMGFNAVALVGLSAAADRSFWPALRADARLGAARTLGWGLASAVALYVVFALGYLLLRLVFGAPAEEGMARVYALKDGVSPARVWLTIALFIGPAEELFWRGFLQRQWAARIGPVRGWTAATLVYGGVHLASGNPVLAAAALVCGAFWGALYLWRKSIWINVLSHTAWDLAVFLLFPFVTPGGTDAVDKYFRF